MRAEPVIAVVGGGPSAEAAVSRVSAAGVADALRRTFTRVTGFELTPDIGEAFKSAGIELVFPVLHGPPGEDGTFQGFLEIIGLPYVGSDVHASSAAMDKVLAKQLFRIHGLPVARDCVVYRRDGVDRARQAVLDCLPCDVVVKPARQGSALGVAFARTEAALDTALAGAFEFDERVLVEERVTGREITVALLERNGLQALPVIEVRTPADTWYDYAHRYTPGSSEHLVPAPLPAATTERVQAIAAAAHLALGCRHLSRVDFVVPDAGEPVVLEVNTMPGMTPTSLFPDAARAAGIAFDALVAHLVDLALGGRQS